MPTVARSGEVCETCMLAANINAWGREDDGWAAALASIEGRGDLPDVTGDREGISSAPCACCGSAQRGYRWPAVWLARR